MVKNKYFVFSDETTEAFAFEDMEIAKTEGVKLSERLKLAGKEGAVNVIHLQFRPAPPKKTNTGLVDIDWDKYDIDAVSSRRDKSADNPVVIAPMEGEDNASLQVGG